MNARATKPPDLQLEHTSDEHSSVLAQVDALRAKGKHALADLVERAYRANQNNRGAFGGRTEPPPPPKRRKRK